MKSINCIFRETLVDGSFKIKSHVLVFIDENGNEFSESFSEVYHNDKFESYQYDGEEFQFMQAMLEKIIDGKVRKTFAEVALLEQIYLLDGVTKISDVLKQNGNSVVSFFRFQVGEGIEKKKDDFAAEVMAATK